LKTQADIAANKRILPPSQMASSNNRAMKKVLQMSLHYITNGQSVLNSPAADT